MQDEPIDKEDILKELSEIHKLDHDYVDGRILGSMCTEAHPFAKAHIGKHRRRFGNFKAFSKHRQKMRCVYEPLLHKGLSRYKGYAYVRCDRKRILCL